MNRLLLIALAMTASMLRADPLAPQDYAPSLAALAPWEDAVPIADPILKHGNTSPYKVDGKTYSVLRSANGYLEEGFASWYGMKFHGRSTSNGEIFDVYGATAAHRSLPIPSYVRVTNLLNQRSVVLRFNDRGPFRADRIMDVSYQAAVELGFAEQGTAAVRVEALSLEGTEDRRQRSHDRFRYLQIGAFASWDKALGLARTFQRSWGHLSYVTPVEVRGVRLHRVRLGPFAGQDELESARTRLLEMGYPEPLKLP